MSRSRARRLSPRFPSPFARCSSIFRKAGVDREAFRASGAKIELSNPAERALGMQLLRLSEALADTAADYLPHHLTDYLFVLARCYSAFFEKSPVLKAETDSLRDSRLLMCDLTARTMSATIPVRLLDSVWLLPMNSSAMSVLATGGGGTGAVPTVGDSPEPPPQAARSRAKAAATQWRT